MRELVVAVQRPVDAVYSEQRGFGQAEAVPLDGDYRIGRRRNMNRIP